MKDIIYSSSAATPPLSRRPSRRRMQTDRKPGKIVLNVLGSAVESISQPFVSFARDAVSAFGPSDTLHVIHPSTDAAATVAEVAKSNERLFDVEEFKTEAPLTSSSTISTLSLREYVYYTKSPLTSAINSVYI